MLESNSSDFIPQYKLDDLLGANVLSNVLSGSSTQPTVRQLREGDLVVIQQDDNAAIHSVRRLDDSWVFTPGTGGDLPLINLDPGADDRVLRPRRVPRLRRHARGLDAPGLRRGLRRGVAPGCHGGRAEGLASRVAEITPP